MGWVGWDGWAEIILFSGRLEGLGEIRDFLEKRGKVRRDDRSILRTV